MRPIIFCFVLLLVSCGAPVNPDKLELLNGYWEIEEVRTQDGQTRTYPASSTIDYIELRGEAGFRKKVQPRLDGGFSTSDDAIRFRILQRGDAIYLVYNTEEENWEEELTALEEDTFSLRSAGGLTYQYKRFEPIEL